MKRASDVPQSGSLEENHNEEKERRVGDFEQQHDLALNVRRHSYHSNHSLPSQHDIAKRSSSLPSPKEIQKLLVTHLPSPNGLSSSRSLSIPSTELPMSDTPMSSDDTPMPIAYHRQLAGDGFNGNNKEIGTTKAMVNLCKCFSGASIFAMPWALRQSGLLLGAVSILILAVLTYYTLYWIGKCSHLHPTISKPTYPEIARLAFGNTGYVTAWIAIICMTVGVCGSYLVFIASELTKLAATDWLDQTVMTAAICLPLILLSMLRSFSFLVPFNVMGLVSVAAATVIVFVESMSELDLSGNPNEVDLVVNSDGFSHYPLFLGNAAFAFLIHSVVLPIEQSMSDRTRHHISVDYVAALKWAMSIATMTFCVFSGVSYLAFGRNVCGNIMDNLDSDRIFTKLVIISLCINLFFTYPFFMFPMTESLEITLFDINPNPNLRDWRIEAKRNGLRACLVIITGAVAIGVPKFAMITGLTGAFGNNVLALIMPPAMYFTLAKMRGVDEHISTMEKVIGCFSTVFGLIMLGLCTWMFAGYIMNEAEDSC